MLYTYQTMSSSGSFAMPEGDDVEYARSLDELRQALELWIDEGARVGVYASDQSLLVWKGTFDDVTDAYPDFEATLGPKGGLRIARL